MHEWRAFDLAIVAQLECEEGVLAEVVCIDGWLHAPLQVDMQAASAVVVVVVDRIVQEL